MLLLLPKTYKTVVSPFKFLSPAALLVELGVVGQSLSESKVDQHATPRIFARNRQTLTVIL